MILLKKRTNLLVAAAFFLVLSGCDNIPQKTDAVGNLDPCAGLSSATRLAINNPLDPCYLGGSGPIDDDDDEGPIQSDCNDNDEDGFPAGTQCPVSVITDCDDTNADINPDAVEIEGNDIDEDCRMSDLDGDGFDDVAAGGTDCNDNAAYINPAATEVQGNPTDEDCSESSEPPHDADDDWYDSTEFGGPDCNDDNADSHPGLTEVCGNDVDEDCDGVICTMFLTPSDGTTGVPPNVIISVSTSTAFAFEPDLTFVLSRSGAVIDGELEIYNDRKALRFVPDVQLDFGVNYDILIRSEEEQHTATFRTIPDPGFTEQIVVEDNRNLANPIVYKVNMLHIYQPSVFNNLPIATVQDLFFDEIILGISHIVSTDWINGNFTLTHARPFYIDGTLANFDAGETAYQYYGAEVTSGTYFKMHQANTYYELGGESVLVDYVDISGEFYAPAGFQPTIINGRFKLRSTSCIRVCQAVLPTCDATICGLTSVCNNEQKMILAAFLGACGTSLSDPLYFDIGYQGTYRQLNRLDKSPPVLSGGEDGAPINMAITFDSPETLLSSESVIPYNNTIYEIGDYRTVSSYTDLYLSSKYHSNSTYRQITSTNLGPDYYEISGINFVLPTKEQITTKEKWLDTGERYDARFFFGPYTTIYPDILFIPEPEEDLPQ